LEERVLSATLQDGLKAYRIGSKLRALRLKRKMGLVELGRHTGLSPAMLSKIERGRLFPTLPTLLRIALVFSVGLEFFFVGARAEPVIAVVRKSARLTFPEKPAARDNAYEFQSLDFPAVERPFNAYFAEFFPVPPERVRMHQHAGGELIYVLRGSLSVHVAGEEHVLDEEDSMYFDATIPHGYRKSAGRKCTALVVTSAA
jgi:transcriptional regulator with XRE-family HTH domain